MLSGEYSKEHPDQLAILFGSHATPTTHEASHIDLAVEFAARRPSDPGHNEVFFGLSPDLGNVLGMDTVGGIE